jgi:hypothetical protein
MKKMNPPIIYLKMSLKAMQISTFWYLNLVLNLLFS